MPNSSKYNALLVNGQEQMLSLSQLWLELNERGWRWHGFNANKNVSNFFSDQKWPTHRFLPLPVPSSSIKIIFAIMLWLPWLIFKFLFLLIYKARKKINLILGFKISDILLLAPIAKMLNLPLYMVLCPHSIREFKEQKGKNIYVKLAKYAQLLVFCNDSKKQLLKLGIDEERLHIIRPGIKIKASQHQADIFSSLAAADKNRSNKKFFSLGTIVELNEGQNIELLLQAAKKCLTVVQELQIVIIGDGPERKKLAWLAKKLNLTNLIWFVGEQKHLKKWLDNLDIYISTCTIAGINDMINTLQAAITGLPIIAHQDIGLDDVINDKYNNGLLIKNDDNEILAQAIIALYKNKSKRKQLAQNAQQTIKDNFLLEHMAQDFQSVINNK